MQSYENNSSCTKIRNFAPPFTHFYPASTGMKTRQYIILTLLFLLSLGKTVEAQRLLLRESSRETAASANKNVPFSVEIEDKQTLSLAWRLGNVWSDTTDFTFLQLYTDGFENHTSEAGRPMLPAFHRLITLPSAGNYAVEIVFDSITSLPLPAHLGAIFPTQPSLGKETQQAFTLDDALYSSDNYYGLPAVQLQDLGILRGQRLLKLTVIPIAYNPVAHTLLLHDSLKARIYLQENDTKSLVQYHNSATTTTVPPVYMVASVDSFRTSLQPFIDWKRRQGYAVETIFAPSWQQETLREALAKRYHASTSQHPAPTYLLLVGDVEQIPAWQGTASVDALGQHATDLYYAEYTGDRLPEVMMGRFSAKNIAQLQAIVHKTLAYEQFALVDTTYLNRALLVAGYEERGQSQTLTNGQVNYLKGALREHSPTIDTHCFYNPASRDLQSNILGTWSQGMGHVNYSAHCLVEGWQNPSVNRANIDSMPANERYSVVVNNCCHSNNFRSECFGEALLRKPNGGAIGVIGATCETLWEEDYYWAVGTKRPFVLQPLYNSTAMGAYDRLLHRQNEPYYQQVATLGEMLLAGNIAVTEAGSPYADYYWEAYCLLGDPSLMPYIGRPESIHLTLTAIDNEPTTAVATLDKLPKGTTQLAFRGTPFARIAIEQDTCLLGSTLLDSLGNGTMRLAMPILADSLRLTATAQYHIPLLKTVQTHRNSKACLTPCAYRFTNTAGQEVQQILNRDTILLAISVVNIGDSMAHNGFIRLAQADNDSNVGYQMQRLDTIHYLYSMAPDSMATVTFRLIVETEGTTEFLSQLRSAISSATINPLLPATHRQERQDAPLQVNLFSVVEDEDDAVRYTLSLPLERPQLAVVSARLLAANDNSPHDNKAVTRLLPGQHYWLQLIATNQSASNTMHSRLCITHIEGAECLTGACHAGVATAAQSIDTLYLPLRAHDTLRHIHLGITLECDNRPTEYSLYFLPDSAIESFEGGFSHYPWDTLAAFPWQIDSTVRHSGRYAARPATITNRQQSELSLTLLVNARDTVAFWVKSSSEQNGDKLSFYVGNGRRGSWSGIRDWRRAQYIVQPGLQRLTWRFEKDEEGDVGEDCVWIDDIRLPLSAYLMPAGYGDSVMSTLSIAATTCHDDLLLYPNPSKGTVTFANTSGHSASLVLMNTTGQRYESWTLPAHTATTATLHHLPDGVYLVIIHRAERTFIKKLLLVK